MADDEYLELMYLYRVIRNEDGTPEEIKRCQELLRKFREEKSKRELPTKRKRAAK